MENRVVALSVLEDLVHWPLAPRDGSTPKNFSSFYSTGKCGGGGATLLGGRTSNGNDGDGGGGSNDDDGGDDGSDDDDAAYTVPTNAADDQCLEPRARRHARYRAVLLLPHLCHKLGARWTTSEVVPYLLRCVEEEDPQLALSVGLAVLGLVKPSCGKPAEGRRAKPRDGDLPSAASSGPSSPAPLSYSSYLTLDAVQPVVEALAGSKDACIRQFVAEVVLPHMFFGMSLERDMAPAVGGWEAKYTPARVWADDPALQDGDAELAVADDEDSTACAIRLLEHYGREEDEAETSSNSGSDAEEEPADVESGSSRSPSPASSAAAQRRRQQQKQQQQQLHRQQQQRRRRKGRRPADPLRLQESLSFLCDDECATLSLPHLRDPLLARCGLRDAGTSSTLAETSERAKRAALLRRLRVSARAPSGSITLMRHAPLTMYGASYAAERADDDDACASFAGSMGFFYPNVQAQLVVDDLVAWMDGLRPFPQSNLAAAPGSSPSGAAAARQPASPPRKRFLCAADYFSDDADSSAYGTSSHTATPTPAGGASAVPMVPRREALKQRWQEGQQLIQTLLHSAYPGAVAVAIEFLSLLHNSVHAVFTGVSSDALRLPSLPPTATSTHSLRRTAEDMLVVAKPSAPLRAEVELQSFRYYSARRHVAYCLAAATASTHRMSASTEAADVEALVRMTLSALLTALSEELSSSSVGVLVPVSLPAGAAGGSAHTTQLSPRRSHLLLRQQQQQQQQQLQAGPGPREARVRLMASWDVCFSAHAAEVAAADNADTSPIGCSATAGRDEHRNELPYGPVDVAHLLFLAPPASTAGGSGGSAADAPAVLYGTVNMSSQFRLHRVVRVALLRSLPLLLNATDLLAQLAVAAAPAPSVPGTPASSTFSRLSMQSSDALSLSLDVVCRLLVEVLAPPSIVPALLADVFSAASPSGSANTSNSMVGTGSPTMPAVRMSAFSAAAGAEESPASLDFGVVEAALAALHRLCSEIAVALPILLRSAYRAATAPSVDVLSLSSSLSSSFCSAMSSPCPWRTRDEHTRQATDAVLHRLCALFEVAASAAAAYAPWKARWLLAKKLPGLAAALLLVIARVAEAGQTAAERANRPRAPSSPMGDGVTNPFPPSSPAMSSLPELAATYYARVVRLLATLWSSSVTSSGSSTSSTSTVRAGALRDWISDDECELRCVAVPCAAILFDVVVQGATRVAAAQAREVEMRNNALAAAAAANDPPRSARSHVRPVKPAADRAEDSRRASHADALFTSLSPLLSALIPLHESVAAACAAAQEDRSPRVRCAAAAAWSSLSRTLSALVVLTSTTAGAASAEAAGWRAALSKATDALLSLMTDGSSVVQLVLVSELADLLVTAPVPAGADGAAAQDSAQVRHAALLSCLGNLSRHEVWRFRERYAVLLCGMCGRFLAPRRTASTAMRRYYSQHPPKSAAGGLGRDGLIVPQTGWTHTHPLFRLAREELLPMLVAILFDKVKAVRDTALDATAQLCARIRAIGVDGMVLPMDAGLGSESGGDAGNGGGSGGGGGGGGGGAGGGAAGEERMAGESGASDSNRFVNDVVWPLIKESPRAWETYLSRSALLRVAVRLAVDKESILMPLLDQLAHDSVLNVRLVAAKTIHEVLRRSGSSESSAQDGSGLDGAASTSSPYSSSSPRFDRLGASSPSVRSAGGMGSSYTGSFIGAGSPNTAGKSRVGLDGGAGRSSDDAAAGGGDALGALPSIVFSAEEKNGAVLLLLRQLLEDPSADVRDEAAKALKICF